MRRWFRNLTMWELALLGIMLAVIAMSVQVHAEHAKLDAMVKELDEIALDLLYVEHNVKEAIKEATGVTGGE